MREWVNIAVLVSGGGTNLQALLDAQADGKLRSGRIALVLSNKRGAYALHRAEEAGVPTAVVTVADCGGAAEMEAEMLRRLEEARIDLIVLAGFMHILTPAFVSRYPQRMLNVHPSLIPAFCGEGYYGLRVHEAALARGVRLTGATVHYVNEIPDGGEILLQKSVRVYRGDTPERLQMRVMRQAEWKLLPAAAELVAQRILKEENGHERV